MFEVYPIITACWLVTSKIIRMLLLKIPLVYFSLYTASELYECRKNCCSLSQFSDSKLQISAKFRAHFVHKAKLQNLRMKVDSILIFQNQHAIKSTVKWWPFLGALARDSKIIFFGMISMSLHSCYQNQQLLS